VLARLDYGNAILVSLPVYLTCRLQSVLNSAAQLIYHMRSSDHITNALATLRWLRVPDRITYKIAVLSYNVLHGSVPRYLGPLVPVSDQPSRRDAELYGYQSASRNTRQALHSRQPSLPGCQSPHLDALIFLTALIFLIVINSLMR